MLRQKVPVALYSLGIQFRSLCASWNSCLQKSLSQEFSRADPGYSQPLCAKVWGSPPCTSHFLMEIGIIAILQVCVAAPKKLQEPECSPHQKKTPKIKNIQPQSCIFWGLKHLLALGELMIIFPTMPPALQMVLGFSWASPISLSPRGDTPPPEKSTQ